MSPDPAGPLAAIEDAVVACRRCPRLVDWRETAPERAPRALRGDVYWARPVPGWGDPRARIYVLGLATSANGGNRTGRPFTGNPTADRLMAVLHSAHLASQPTSRERDDGLKMRDVWMGSAVRCAPPQNRPTAQEQRNCLPFLEAELRALVRLRVVLALGRLAWDRALKLLNDGPSVRFAHGAEQPTEMGITVLGSYHPSPQNMNTGRLTVTMLDAVVARAVAVANCGSSGTASPDT